MAPLVAILTVLFTAAVVEALHPQSRHVEIMNQSGKNLKIYWIDSNGKAVDFTQDRAVQNGGAFIVDSFVNHTLMVSDDNTTEACDASSEGCHVNYITVGERKGDQVYFVHEDMTIDESEYSNDSSSSSFASDAVELCKQKVTHKLGGSLKDATEETVSDFVKCIETVATAQLVEKNEQIALEAKSREHVSNLLENYTCADKNLATTAPIATRTWTYRNETTRDVLVLHERQASQIHVLKNFISAEECQAIQDAAAPKLHRGTVADGSGGSKLSDHRKAWQAGVSIPWDKEQEGDPIARVTRRIYEYANHATGYGLEVEGQEDIMSIQYFGLGEDEKDTAPDQYRPHCDGDCAGLPHKTGGRLATMVMYCTVPEQGGSTNFGNAGVHVKPELHAAAFFSYMDPTTGLMEKGFTSHSGCPVIKGTKRIAVQWMRLGVDEENPWDSFNTLTVRRGQEEEDC